MATCPRCGRTSGAGSTNCDYCGAPLKTTAVPSEPSVWGTAPRGVALMGWAQEIVGGLTAGLGVLGVVLGTVSSLAVTVLGAAFLFGGAVLFYLGYSLRRGVSWAWKYDIVALVVIAVTGAVTFFLGVYPVEDWALVFLTGASVYYLLTPGVRGFFDRSDAD